MTWARLYVRTAAMKNDPSAHGLQMSVRHAAGCPCELRSDTGDEHAGLHAPFVERQAEGMWCPVCSALRLRALQEAARAAAGANECGLQFVHVSAPWALQA